MNMILNLEALNKHRRGRREDEYSTRFDKEKTTSLLHKHFPIEIMVEGGGNDVIVNSDHLVTNRILECYFVSSDNSMALPTGYVLCFEDFVFSNDALSTTTLPDTLYDTNSTSTQKTSAVPGNSVKLLKSMVKDVLNGLKTPIAGEFIVSPNDSTCTEIILINKYTGRCHRVTRSEVEYGGEATDQIGVKVSYDESKHYVFRPRSKSEDVADWELVLRNMLIKFNAENKKTEYEAYVVKKALKSSEEAQKVDFSEVETKKAKSKSSFFNY